DPERLFNDDDLAFAEHIGRRSATAVDNALLYRRSEERAHAALALAFVGDGVLLVDDEGVVRIWNAAAAAITGLPTEQIGGRRATLSATASSTGSPAKQRGRRESSTTASGPAASSRGRCRSPSRAVTRMRSRARWWTPRRRICRRT